MQSIRQSVLIAHNALSIFQLIDNVENYPQFLPWCGNVIVHEHTSEITDATIYIKYFGLSSQFRTRNDNLAPSQTPGIIKMHFIDGPFRTLSGLWQITPLTEQACKIEFSLDYEFASTTLEKLIGPVFHKITATFVDAFVKEANKIAV
jgi:ribosome-associated toxin RatA of RatAB toxin-antitoxin module